MEFQLSYVKSKRRCKKNKNNKNKNKKEDAMKVLHSICQQNGKLSSGHRTGKGQFSFQSQRKAMTKNTQTITQLHSSHMLAK